MLIINIKKYRSLFTNDVFDTQIINDLKHCQLKLINYLFPNLLTRAKELRYILITVNDKQIAKKAYSKYLKTIYIKTGEMIKNAKNTFNIIKNIEHIFKINIMMKKLLKIIFTSIESTISLRAHENAITNYIILLTHSTEAIRREILPLTILINNFINETRKIHANLTIIIEFLLFYFDKNALRVINEKIFDEKNDLINVIKNESIKNAALNFEQKQIDVMKNKLPNIKKNMNISTNYVNKIMKNNNKGKKKQNLLISSSIKIIHQKNKLSIIFVSILNVYEYLCAKCLSHFEKKIEEKFIYRVK